MVGQVCQLNLVKSFFAHMQKGRLWFDQMVRLNQSHNSSKPYATAQSILVFVKLQFWVDYYNLGFKFFLTTNENETMKKKN